MPQSLSSFDYQPRTRLVFGAGEIVRLGALAREIPNVRRALVVTDKGIVQAGHAERAVKSLEEAGVTAQIFSAVKENPSTIEVAACVEAAKSFKPDLIVGLGGGSSMDTAKGCNFIYSNGGVMKDYWGTGKATKEMLPLIAIPTTAGTGSECQSYALISDPETHQKMACGDVKAAARVAILDPQLTVSQPPRVTALTGLDTLSHAIESGVCNKRNALSLVYSRESLRLGLEAFPQVLSDPNNLDARGRMQLAAAFGGLAIENSMLGAAHSCANPLTGRHGIVHGQAVAIMLPHVIRFNGKDAGAAAAYWELEQSCESRIAAIPFMSQSGNFTTPTEILAKHIEELLELAMLPSRLGQLDVPKNSLNTLATEAAKQWTANFNPRPLTENDFVQLYAAAW